MRNDATRTGGLLALLVIAACAGVAEAQPTVTADPALDAALLRTDLGADGVINPQVQRPIELIEIRHGRFAPDLPGTDLFSGSWGNAGGFVRVELVCAGLINPPGPLNYDGQNPQYDPQRYGPSPIYGFVELDVDADENTGGERAAPEFRYLGIAARWGGVPSQSRFSGRAARHRPDLDQDFSTPPFVERSGEEFHLAFFGEHITQITIRAEAPGGNTAIFESGETWEVRGDFFHRAHGWEQFILTCAQRLGQYQPQVTLLFVHNALTDRTTISLVYPLTNAAAASMQTPVPGTQPHNGCDFDQNSIEEALVDLQFSAMFADPLDRLIPEFQLLAGWEVKSPAAYLDPAPWRVCAALGTAYATQQGDGSVFIYTDILPNVRTGDFNGDGQVNSLDGAAQSGSITALDGNPIYDEDGNGTNASLDLPQFSISFSYLDTNYDGIVVAADRVVMGDMNLNQSVGLEDLPDFVQALVDPAGYTQSHGGTDPRARGDMNGDHAFDAQDIQLFVNLLLGL